MRWSVKSSHAGQFPWRVSHPHHHGCGPDSHLAGTGYGSFWSPLAGKSSCVHTQWQYAVHPSGQPVLLWGHCFPRWRVFLADDTFLCNFHNWGQSCLSGRCRTNLISLSGNSSSFTDRILCNYLLLLLDLRNREQFLSVFPLWNRAAILYSQNFPKVVIPSRLFACPSEKAKTGLITWSITSDSN